MAHWYKFQIDRNTYVICNANRSKEISEVLPFKTKFIGCVSREKIPELRSAPDHVVVNSVARLKVLVPYIPRPTQPF